MVLTGLVLVVSVLAASGCREGEEYTAQDGQCCPLCEEGKIVDEDCTYLKGTHCTPCGAGTFMDRPNGQRKCFLCSSCDPGYGLFTKLECSPTSDTVCEASEGFFCQSVTSAGCSGAEKHSVCKPGQRIKAAGTTRQDTVCENCQDGYFSSEGLTCSLWTTCSDTQTLVKNGSSVKDVVCSNHSTQHHYFLFLTVLPFFLLLCGVW